jgi:hypothetical protein
VAIYENDWILGPWAIDALSVAVGFELPHHAGTVDRHAYKVFGGSNQPHNDAVINDAVLDPNAGQEPPPMIWEAIPFPG